MKDGYVAKIVAMGGISLCYAAYLCWSPNPQDGVLFASVIGALALLAGVDLGQRIEGTTTTVRKLKEF